METSGELAITAPSGRPPRRRFVAHHKWDRNFFLAFLALCWLGVLMGFAPAATKRLAGHADYPAPLILEIHAFAFSAWMALLTSQIGLIRARRPQLHMKLGLVAVGLIPVMAISAFLSEIYSQRFRSAQPDEREFLIIVIFYVIAFTTLASSAIAARKNPPAHKRLILLATTIIVGAAYSRWWGTVLYNLFGDDYGGTLIYTYAGTDLLLAGALAYDWCSRGRLHRVYEIAVPAILAGEVATTIIYHSPAWVPIANLLVGQDGR
jgi:uncharacterized membrane protein